MPFVGRRALIVLAATGATGFAMGTLLLPAWQDVVEPAQVVAGLVHYPAGSPMLLYATRTWSLLHQIPALCLALGASERALTILISGLMGMVSFQALGMAVWAMSEDVVVSIAAPIFIFMARATLGGMAYPIAIIGTPYTSGVIGLSLALLTCGLAASGEAALAGLLAGLLPAVHAPIGVSIAGALGLALWFEPDFLRAHGRRLALWLSIGLAVSAASLLAQVLIVMTPAPGLSAVDARRYFDAVAAYWDYHRRPFSRVSIQAAAPLIGLGSSLVWLQRGRALSVSARILLRAIAIAGVAGLGLSLVLVFDPAIAGGLVWRAMPSRLMNLAGLACMALLIGLAVRLAADRVAALTLVVLLPLALIVQLSPLAYGAKPAAAWPMLLASIVLSVRLYHRGRDEGRARPAWLRPVVITVIGAGFAAWLGLRSTPAWRSDAWGLPDRTTDTFLRTVGDRPGVLLTAGSMHLVQLATRRPVLLDGGAMDALTYVPAAAPSTERVLADVYGIRLTAPPFSPSAATGELDDEAGRELWELRTLQEWQAVCRVYGVTDIVTPDDWRLHLPEVARGDAWVLYAVPR